MSLLHGRRSGAVLLAFLFAILGASPARANQCWTLNGRGKKKTKLPFCFWLDRQAPFIEEKNAIGSWGIHCETPIVQKNAIGGRGIHYETQTSPAHQKIE